ncbi:MAG: four helix bundle protein [Bacteroidota bacterium]
MAISDWLEESFSEENYMKDFRNLEVWDRAHKLALEAYKVTRHFPKEELYGLTNQIRRSSSSIPTNIAEGCGRGSDAEFHRFLIIAMGSASELEYLAILARDLEYLNTTQYNELEQEIIIVRKMLNALIQKVKPSAKR